MWDWTVSNQDFLTDAKREVPAFSLINKYRRDNNLPPLAYSRALSIPSILKAKDDAYLRDTYGDQFLTPAHPYSHTDSLGREPFGEAGRWEACGVNVNAWKGENIVGMAPTAEIAVERWKQSPKHNAVLLKDVARFGGIAAQQSKDGLWWWCLCVMSVDDPSFSVPRTDGMYSVVITDGPAIAEPV